MAAACVAWLGGGDADDGMLVALAGPAAEEVLAGREGGPDGYWPRVWATRGLLYAWEPFAAEAVISALSDDSWRVREMAAKVVCRHRVGGALEVVADLQHDPVPRVRAAAGRAMKALVTDGA